VPGWTGATFARAREPYPAVLIRSGGAAGSRQQVVSMLDIADFSALSTVRLQYHFTWVHALA
jgi:hypothetical protein